MLSIQPKKITAVLMALLITAVSVFFVSCQKELSGEGFTVKETQPDLTTKISSTVSGFVTDETDAAVPGATVQFGGSSTTTDKYGYFEINNVQAVKNAAVVTVIKPGYFNGIKTFIAAEGKKGFFRIKLLPKTNQGSFDAAAGGTVTLANGLAVSFPASAVKLASGGAYTGQVSVAAQWINPVAQDLNRVMPGDLRGLDSAGFIRSLTTYGMAAVELTGAGGELLQVADGKKATLTFPIPSALSGAAPATIPLWSFDETKGLWKQESHAVKSGSNYVGEVSHFSFWNCDVPANYVQFNCTVKDAAGNPVAGAVVKISVVGNPQNAGWGYTDSSGYTGGAVPDNSQLLLEVFSNYSCGSAVHSQTFNTASQNVSLGVITIPGTSTATVSGTVECTGAPLADAYVMMSQGYYYYRYPVNADGTYSFTATFCSSSPAVILIAENLSTMQSGTPLTYSLSAGNNTVPALQACINSTEQFINYTINGTSYGFAYPADSISYGYQGTIGYLSGGSMNGTTGGYVNIAFDQTNIAAGATLALINFNSSQIGDSVTMNSGASVTITEYGNVGEFIAGDFSCTLAGATTTYAIIGNFRARRR